jgi:hypothetical protein
VAPTYALGNAPLNVPVSTLVSFFQVLKQQNKVDDFLQQAGNTSLSANAMPISKVISLFQTVANANGLDDFVTFVGNTTVPVDPGTINSAKDFLFNNNMHQRSIAASSMVNLGDPGCVNNQCPHIPH